MPPEEFSFLVIGPENPHFFFPLVLFLEFAAQGCTNVKSSMKMKVCVKLAAYARRIH